MIIGNGFRRTSWHQFKNGVMGWKSQEEKEQAHNRTEQLKNYKQPERIADPENILEPDKVVQGEYFTPSADDKTKSEEAHEYYERVANDFNDEQKRTFHYGLSKFA